MLMSLLIAAAQPATVPYPVVIDLVAGEGERRCLPDKSLCLDVPGSAEAGDGGLVLTAPQTGQADDLALPYGRDDGKNAKPVAAFDRRGAPPRARLRIRGNI